MPAIPTPLQTVYQKNQTVPLRCSFVNSQGVLTDPGSVTLKVLDPSGTTTTVTNTKETVGIYDGSQVGSTVGTYVVQWTSTAPVADVVEVTFRVQNSSPF